MTALSPLPPHLEALLDAERAVPDIPPELKADVGKRLAESIASGAPVPDIGGDTPGAGVGDDLGGPDLGSAIDAGAGAAASAGASAASAPAASAFAALTAKPALVVATAFGLGVGGGVAGTVVYQSRSEPAVQTAEVRQPEARQTLPTPTAIEPAVSPPSDVPPPSEEVAAPVPQARAKANPRKAPMAPAPAGRDATLAEERALLELSRTAITRGDAATAVDHLRKHAKAFRRGRLAEEREALWVQALLLSRDKRGAQAKARRFLKRHPKSLFTPMMEQVLQELQP